MEQTLSLTAQPAQVTHLLCFLQVPQKTIKKKRKRSEISKTLLQLPMVLDRNHIMSSVPLGVHLGVPSPTCSTRMFDLTPAASSKLTTGNDIEVREVSAMSSDASESSVPDEEDNKVLSAQPTRKKKRMKVMARPFFLDDLVERDLVEWYRNHPILYNKGLREYKDTAKKARLFEEKGLTMTPKRTGKLQIILFKIMIMHYMVL